MHVQYKPFGGRLLIDFFKSFGVKTQFLCQNRTVPTNGLYKYSFFYSLFSISPYFTLILSNLSIIGSAKNHRKNAVDAACTKSKGRPAA